MIRSPNPIALRATRRSRNVVGFLAAVVLGILTWNGLAVRGWQPDAGLSSVSAAESPPAREAGAAADEELSDEPGKDKPAGASKSDAVPIEYLPRPSKQEAKIMEALDKPTRVEFEAAPFENCIKYLHEFHKISIWIDRATLTDEGVPLDQPITLNLAGVNLRSVLKLLLEPLQLTYVIEDDVLKITTCGRAMDKLLTRTYPVRDLYHGRILAADQPLEEIGVPRRLHAESRPGDLEMAILKSIDPESWDDKQGPGAMTYISEAGCLVIRQTTTAHQEILQLLRDLREAKRVGQAAPQGRTSRRTGWKLRGSKREETYSLVGIMDLDGDGEDDSGRLRRVIKGIGGSIDNEVDERGELRVDGRFPDDRRPSLSEKTKFVVLGRIPQVADLTDPEEMETSLKIAGFYKELEDQARARGVRIISLEDFLRYIGYEQVEIKTAVPRHNPPSDQ
jgi:hypothetical protein